MTTIESEITRHGFHFKPCHVPEWPYAAYDLGPIPGDFGDHLILATDETARFHAGPDWAFKLFRRYTEEDHANLETLASGTAEYCLDCACEMYGFSRS